MWYNWGFLLLLLTILAMGVTVRPAILDVSEENGVKSGVYLSPPIVMGSGMALKKFYHNLDFPKGHIALKEFRAEIVDELGNPVPLSESYIHHWVITPYYALTDHTGKKELKTLPIKNSGACDTLRQYFGVGSETRGTESYVPDPYGIEIGNPAAIPDGYEWRWYLNMHAIDMRGVVDQLGCAECRCDLYNITKDEDNRPLTADYPGGFMCCYDETYCKLKEGFQNIRRTVYFRYTVKWVDWVDTIVPVRIYLLDVSDTGERAVPSSNTKPFIPDPSGKTEPLIAGRTGCREEYSIMSCGGSSNVCLDNKRTTIVMPKGGYLIYGVGHQHTAGIGTTLYGEDGRTICTSLPIYGKGKEAGNETGYIVGMTTCYPNPGSVKISNGEALVFESRYINNEMHTGVMGIFILFIADQLPNDMLLSRQVNEHIMYAKYSGVFVFGAAAIAMAVGISYKRKHEGEEGYRQVLQA